MDTSIEMKIHRDADFKYVAENSSIFLMDSPNGTLGVHGFSSVSWSEPTPKVSDRRLQVDYR